MKHYEQIKTTIDTARQIMPNLANNALQTISSTRYVWCGGNSPDDTNKDKNQVVYPTYTPRV